MHFQSCLYRGHNQRPIVPKKVPIKRFLLIVPYSDLNCEMAFVLYNIGVMNAYLGNKQDRATSESMKAACSHYQAAAWAFHTLPDWHTFEEIVDLNPDYLAFMSQVCFFKCRCPQATVGSLLPFLSRM
jgi:hypothetical protein